MSKAKLSELLEGTRLHWNKEKGAFEKLEKEVPDIELKNIVENEEILSEISELSEKVKSDEIDELQCTYELIKLVADMEFDVDFTTFKQKYNSAGLIFIKFARSISEYIIDSVSELEGIKGKALEMDKLKSNT